MEVESKEPNASFTCALDKFAKLFGLGNNGSMGVGIRDSPMQISRSLLLRYFADIGRVLG